MSNELIPKVDTNSLDNSLADIANQVIAETDVTKTKDLVDLFNWNLSKKNVARVLKLNELFDDVTDQMAMRIKNKPDQYSHSELIDYMKAIQGAIDTSNKNLSAVETPPTIVQQNNTQINVNVIDKFDRDSRERILSAIQKTLLTASQPLPEPVEHVIQSNENDIGEVSDEQG